MTEVGELSAYKLLVVDDIETNIDMLIEVLADDYEVSVALDGVSALETVRENRPDLILLDIMMPGMDGLEVCRRLQADESTRDIPIIFVTALGDIEDEAEGFAAGGVDYITKPISPPIVQARVKNHLQLMLARRKLQERNEALKDYNRLRDEMERIIQQDIKTPLTTVLTAPAMLRNSPRLTRDEIDVLDMIDKSGHRILEIINRSVDLFRMERGEYIVRPTPIDLIGLTNKIRQELAGLIEAGRTEFRVMINDRLVGASDAVWVSGEEMLVYSMLSNLIGYAVDACPMRGEATVRFTTADSVGITIRHTGELSRPDVEVFFSKFGQTQPHARPTLGNYLAQLIARTMGGAVEIESSSRGGTKISIQLPRAEEAPTAEASVRAAAPPEERTVLVMEKQTLVRRVILAALRHMGLGRIMEAADLKQASAALAGGNIGLIISSWDVNHPAGEELYRLARRENAPALIPFIAVLSVGARPGQDLIDDPIADRLTKPFAIDDLRAMVERLLT